VVARRLRIGVTARLLRHAQIGTLVRMESPRIRVRLNDATGNEFIEGLPVILEPAGRHLRRQAQAAQWPSC